MLSVQHLSKRFGQTVALDDISFEAVPGQIMGVIGPSGAGKTTLIRAVAGAVTLSSGQIKRPERVGYVSQEFSLYGDLTVLENMQFFARLHGQKNSAGGIEQRLRGVSLWPFADRLAGQLSGGMKQKLSIAAALVSEPPLLLLDEPTAGIDPVSREELWQMLKQQAAAGRAIVCSTQYMEEIANMQQVMLLRQGHCLALGEPHALLAAYPQAVWRLPDVARLRSTLRPKELTRDQVTVYWRGNDLIMIGPAGTDPSGWPVWPALATHLAGQLPQPVLPSFEDLYISYQHQGGEAACR